MQPDGSPAYSSGLSGWHHGAMVPLIYRTISVDDVDLQVSVTNEGGERGLAPRKSSDYSVKCMLDVLCCDGPVPPLWHHHVADELPG